MKRLLLLSLFLIVLSATFVCGEDHEIRTWTSVPTASGKVFKADGYLKEVTDDGENVILVINGKEKKVEMKRLSSSDHQYIQSIIDKKGKKEDPATKEGETFTFYNKQIEVLRPVYGVHLGESIESLSLRAQVTEISDYVQCYQIESNLGDYEPEKYAPEIIRTLHDYPGILKCYDVKGIDDDVDSIHVYAVNDRILCVYVFPKGIGDELWDRSNDVVKKKYPWCEEHKDRCDKTNENFHIRVSVVFALKPNSKSSKVTEKRNGKTYKYLVVDGLKAWSCQTVAVVYEHVDMCDTTLNNLPKSDFEEKM